MKFPALLKGHFLTRYKRFFADIELDNGQVVTAHCPNTGSMHTCLGHRWPCLISEHDGPTRKLKYTLEMLHNGKTWIAVNTSLANALAVEGIKTGKIKELQGYDSIRQEAVIDAHTRFDLLLLNETDAPCYVEIKNVTLLGENGQALFPDAVTTRGQKHLQELIKLKKQGYRAVQLYVIAREDVQSFSPAASIDPDYAQLLTLAIQTGVEALAYQCRITPEEITIHQRIEINPPPKYPGHIPSDGNGNGRPLGGQAQQSDWKNAGGRTDQSSARKGSQ
ncbi:MAG: DNA/RNA nuclease SfsA [Pseudomonadota bacterium]